MARPSRDQKALFDPDAPADVIRRALVVRQPWAGMIAGGRKRWEIRGNATGIREWIAIAAAGTGTIVGICRLADVRGPLDWESYADAWRLWGGDERPTARLPYRRTYAWVLEGASTIEPPIAYRHPAGAVIWVRLEQAVRERLVAAMRQERQRPG